MKTSVIMKSQDRELFGIIIRQETKNGFLSLTELQKAYEAARWKFGWSDTDISALMQSKKMTERIYYLLKERKIIETNFVGFMEMVENNGLTKLLKGLNLWKTTGRGANRTVMADPYIWTAIALELNPMIYAKVISFITDSLLFDRIEAGNEFKPMNKAIKSIIPNPNYPEYSIAINKAVFGQHMTGMRNLATSSQLKQITQIEQFITEAIEAKLITSHHQIINYINSKANINNYRPLLNT